MTPEVVSKLEGAFAQGFSDVDACILAEIDVVTLYRYCQKHESFAKKKEALKRRPFLSTVLGINKLIKAEDPTTLRWYAERKGKDEFSTRTENTGADGAPIQMEVAVTKEKIKEVLVLFDQAMKEVEDGKTD